ncbi:MAG: hypothetical protein C5B54_09725, partial [Acidobacteria bacterium]
MNRKINFFIVLFFLFTLTLFAAADKQTKNLLKAVDEADVAKATAAIQAGANVNDKDADGWTPLMLAAAAEKPSIGLITALTEAKADVNA